MSSTAVVLLLIAALTHAGWNFLGKRDHPTLAYFLVANTIGVVCVLPILIYYCSKIPFIPPTVWMFSIISGFFLASYMTALAGAYRVGDMSIAYPLARSLPVIIVTMIIIFLGKGHEIGEWLIVGIVLVVAGCLMLPMKEFSDFRLQNYLDLCCLLAVLAAIGISGYTVVDDEALRRLRQLPGKPFDPVNATLVYLVLEGICASFWKGVFVLVSSRERKNLVEVWHSAKGYRDWNLSHLWARSRLYELRNQRQLCGSVPSAQYPSWCCPGHGSSQRAALPSQAHRRGHRVFGIDSSWD
jgi:uncharacterized membrane protein